MPKLMIFNREEEYIGDVKDVIQANQKLEINGEDSLTIETLDNRLEKGYRILYHDRDADKFYEYIIQEKEEYKDGKTIIIDIYADNSISELIGDYIEDKRSINEFASHAIERALEGTRWNMGRFYNGWRGTTTFYRTNARAAISAIMDEWQLEMETEIEFDKESGKIKRTLHLVYERGQFRNNKLTYTRDIVDIKRKTLTRDVITALYGYGKGEQTESGGYTRRINFSDINNGKAYVENNEAKELWGRVGNDGNKIHTFAKIEFESIEDKQLLLERTQSELGKLSKPAVSYEISILDFFRLSKSKHNYIELGDTVRVLDRDFTPQINFNTRVIEIIRDLVNVENTRITLGEVVKNIADRESEQDKKIDEINEEVSSLPDWGDDEDGDGDWGSLPEYERAEDLVKNHPSLGIGLSSWVDVNETDAVSFDGSGRVNNLKDAINNNIIYEQRDMRYRPSIKNMDGRRWVSFNPDPRTMLRWEHGEDRPEDAIQQHGQFLNHLNKDETVRTIYIVYYDRTPDVISTDFTSRPPAEVSQNNRKIRRASNSFPTGYSSPLGYPYSYTMIPSAGTSSTATAYNGKLTPFYISSRIRDEVVIGRPSPISTYSNASNFNNLGMNKKDYDGWIDDRDVTVMTYSNSWSRYVYEMNAFFTGEITEVIVYNRELDPNEHEIITDYLESKYGTYNILR